MSTTPSSSAEAPAAPPAPTLGQAFVYWLRLGFLSFGGPAGQIALMQVGRGDRCAKALDQ